MPPPQSGEITIIPWLNESPLRQGVGSGNWRGQPAGYIGICFDPLISNTCHSSPLRKT